MGIAEQPRKLWENCADINSFRIMTFLKKNSGSSSGTQRRHNGLEGKTRVSAWKGGTVHFESRINKMDLAWGPNGKK